MCEPHVFKLAKLREKIRGPGIQRFQFRSLSCWLLANVARFRNLQLQLSSFLVVMQLLKSRDDRIRFRA